MKPRRSKNLTFAGIAGAITIGLFGLALLLSARGQAEEGGGAILQYPDFPPTPTVSQARAGLASVTGTVLAAPEFADQQSLAAWEFVDVDRLLPEERSVWKVEGGSLIQDRTAYARTPNTYETMALTGEKAWTDYTVATQFYNEYNLTAGVVARRQGNSFYRYRVSADEVPGTPRQVLEKVVNGEVTALATVDSPGFAKYTWHTLSLSVNGSKIQARLNGKLMAEATDTALSSGQAGLYTRAVGGMRFTDFTVSTP